MFDSIRNGQNERPGKTSEAGQSFTEMAISMVFILVLLAGVVDLGRMFWVFVTLRDAAQEGAAYGSFCPADTSGIESRVRNSSTNPVDLNGPNITIDFDPDCSITTCSVGDPLTITVANPTFRMSMPFMNWVTVPLSSAVTDTILSVTQTCPP